VVRQGPALLEAGLFRTADRPYESTMLHVIDATTRVPVAAVLLTRRKVQEMCAHEACLAGSKPVAAAHDMRVASRRLREVLSLFQEWLDPGACEKLRRYGRRVTKALGPVRNVDVALRFFRALRNELNDETERRAIQRIVRRLSRSRRKWRKAMTAAITRLRLRNLSHDIYRFLPVPQVNKPENGPMLYELAQPLLQSRLEHAFQYQTIVQDESKQEELHQMRIAFKKVRYALEIFEPAFDQEYEKISSDIQSYQERLGKIHDLDIFVLDLQRLSTRWRKKRKRRKLLPALDAVIDRLIQRRHDLFVDFCDYLSEHHSAAICKACDASLEACRISLGSLGHE